jgi:hypothetical protein
MKFLIFLSTLLGASITAAAPSRDSHAVRRHGRHGGSTSRSRPKQSISLQANDTYTAHSTNWAGAVLISSGFTSVTGNIVAPSVTSTAASTTEQAGTAWVGIDGDTCKTLLQTGISWYVKGQQVEYVAWYEWLPEASRQSPQSRPPKPDPAADPC